MEGLMEGWVGVCVRECVRTCICVIDTFGDRFLWLRRGGCVVVRCNSIVVTVVVASVCGGYAHAVVSFKQLVSE